ncbi:DNA repair protein RadC [Planctomycetota bacterium]
MPTIKDLPQSERPRERLINFGPQQLSDQDLLAVLLGRGTAKQDVLSLSRSLIKTIDQRGLNLTAEDLLSIEGIGPAKAGLLAAAFEFVRRRIRPEGLKISQPIDVLPVIRHYADRKQEHMLCISLNGAHEVLNVRVVTIGLVDQTHVHPREVFADVIAERASAIVIAHNHPSGQLEPSQDDRFVTQQIKVAGELLGIQLLDHIIFTPKGHYSFAEHEEL